MTNCYTPPNRLRTDGPDQRPRRPGTWLFVAFITFLCYLSYLALVRVFCSTCP